MQGIRDRHTVPRAYHSLRLSLGLPVLIAALALTALWGYTASGLVRDGLRLRGDTELASSLATPTRTLISRLQHERLVTMEWLAVPSESSRAALDDARMDTGVAAEAFHTAHSGPESTSAALRRQVDGLSQALDDHFRLLPKIDQSTLTSVEVFRSFSDTTTEAIALLAATSGDDAEFARGTAAVTSLVQLSEAFSREAALASGVQPDEAPEAAVREEFARAVALQRHIRIILASQDLPAGPATAYERLTDAPRWSVLVAAEETDAADTTRLPELSGAWPKAVDGVGGSLRELAAEAQASVIDDGASQAMRLLVGAALGTVVALAALAFAVALAMRRATTLAGLLSRLEHTTREFADALFAYVARPDHERRGAPPAVPSIKDYGTAEVGQLAEALSDQWQRAVDVVVRQERGRQGSETVFLGLARRTQVLINRMIPRLDKLEREHQDSRLLKDIFAVDHLATRVRRHTENLLIIGGALPARRWGKPVPIYEVMRSAISETEDYSRVEALPAPQVSLVGRAVADIVHLLAELIENGTSFSPPETRVSVSAEVVAKGRVALEVVDRGLGMSAEEYERLNALLSDPPKLDMMALGEAPRLGLFVVARLAKRHGLQMSLRKSPYGGTLAVVLLPSELLEESRSLLSGIIPDAPQAQGSLEPPSGSPESQEAAADSGADSGSPRQVVDDYSGYPAYGGAGLLPATSSTPTTTSEPSEPVTNGTAREDAEVPATWSHRSVDPFSPGGGINGGAGAQGDAADAAFAGESAGGFGGDGTPHEPTAQAETPFKLPVRVRGESLAEQLRTSAPGEDGQGPADAPSPHRAGATMAAIQSGNRRARTANSASPPGGHGSPADTAGHGADAEGSVRKDQR